MDSNERTNVEDPRILRLRELREKTKLGGGEKRISEQHEKGKMTARERIDYLLDKHDSDRGGTDETSLGKTSTVQPSTGWGTTLGSRLPVASSVEPGDEPDPDDEFG